MRSFHLTRLSRYWRSPSPKLRGRGRGMGLDTAVPDELAFEVSAGLLFAGDRDAVKSVFAGARTGL